MNTKSKQDFVQFLVSTLGRPAIRHLQLLHLAPSFPWSLTGVGLHFRKQSQVFLKSCFLKFYIMLPASGTSYTEFVCTGSVEKMVLTGICSTTLLLTAYGDVAMSRKIKVKQKDYRNAPPQKFFFFFLKCKILKNIIRNTNQRKQVLFERIQMM